GEALFHPEFPEKPGYEIDISALTGAASGGGGGQKAAEGPVDWGVVLADPAQAAAGQKVAVKCLSCHNLDSGGPNMTGPNLYGVVDRPAGSHPGFAYSATLKGYGQNWTYENLNKFIANPAADMKGTMMSFVGLKKQEDRTAVI